MLNRKTVWLCLALLATTAALSDVVMESTAASVSGMPVATHLATTAEFTVEAWIYPASNRPTQDLYIWQQFEAERGGRGGLMVNGSTVYYYTASGKAADGSNVGSTVKLALTSTLASDKWTHVAASRGTNGTVRLYLDGALVSTTDADYRLLPNVNMTVGGFVNSNLKTWAGRLSDVRVWKCVRSDAEIAANYMKRLSGNETNLVSYLPFDDIVGNTAFDLVTGQPCALKANQTACTDAGLSLEATDRRPMLDDFVLATGNSKTAVTTDVSIVEKTFTIEGWLYLTEKMNGENRILSQFVPGQVGRMNLQIKSGGTQTLKFYINGYTSSGVLESRTDVPLREWTHFAIVRDGLSCKMYLNGQLDNSLTGTSNLDIPSAPFTLFNYLDATALKGYLREVRLWSVARTAEEIAANRDFYLTGKEAGLKGLWPLTEGNGLQVLNRVTGTMNAVTGSATSWKTLPVPRLAWGGTSALLPHVASTERAAGDTGMTLDVTDFTIEAWVHPNRRLDETFVLRQYNTDTPGRMNVGFHTNSVYGIFIGGPDETGRTAGWAEGGRLPINAWTHIAVTREGTTVRLYRNGTLEAEYTDFTALTSPSVSATLGWGSFVGTGLREVRVWNRARTAMEIARAYDKTLRGSEGGLLAYWPLDTQSYTLVNAKRGGTDGTLLAAWYPDEPLELNGELPPVGTIISFR